MVNHNITEIQNFVKKNKAEIEAFITKRLFPKIGKDIALILLRKWASEVSDKDLYHVHVMVPNFLPNLTLARIEASCSLLYHSEQSYKENPNRNILSNLTSDPKVLNYGSTVSTIYPLSLKMLEICSVKFSRHITGLKFKIIWQSEVE